MGVKGIKRQITHKYANKMITLVFLFIIVFTALSAVNTVSADQSSIYVSDSVGNDSWNGESLTWDGSTLFGPKKSIKNATGTVLEGGTVNIADGLYTGENNTNITIGKNMTITGQSRDGTVINGTNSAQIFLIKNNTNVVIQKLTLANGNATQDLTFKNITAGGAISNAGDLTVKNITFVGNIATGNNETDIGGGAIFNIGNLTINDSTFTDNTAKSNNVTLGGAILNIGNLTIINGNFTGNTATGGGAIGNFGYLNITGSWFTGNTVTGNYTLGGAICNGYNSTLNINGGILNITGSWFTGNTASGGNITAGGAIYNEKDLTILNSTFTHNKASSTDNIGAGGSIFNAGILTASGSKFINNTASGSNADSRGGAVYNYGVLTFKTSIFTGNLADNGGAIFNLGNLTVSSGNIMYNNAINGGAILNCGNLIVSDNNFLNNTASGADDNSMGGGAISNTGNLTVGNYNVFTGNKAYVGGAISNYGGTSKAPVKVSSSTFTSNTATAGGAIYNYGALAVNSDIFTGNIAHTTDSSLAYEGGAILNDGNLTVTGSTFTGNFANLGGAISNRYNSTISGSNFISNKADYDGGAIYNEYGTLTVHFSRIIGNQLVGYGSQDITNYKGKANAEYNWWGSNAGPSKGRIQYETDSSITDASVTNWLVLTLSASPTTVKARGTSTITANLCYDNHGVYHSPASGHVPDGIPVSFTTKFGTIGSQSTTVNGIAKSTLKAGSTGGVVNVSAKTDSQTVQIPLKVTSTYPKNGALGCSRTATIYLKFSQNIKASTYWSKIYVKNLKTGKIVAISKSISGNTFYIKMSSRRYAYCWYQVYIPASAVKDNAGHTLSKSYTFRFKTGKY